MDAAWPVSSGEAIHTSTFLGHPVGCAMALAQIEEIRRRQLVPRSRQLGKYLLRALQNAHGSARFQLSCRGLGLMAGVEVRLPEGVPATLATLQIIKTMLQAGFILLPEGAAGNVISFTPPLTISRAELARTVAALTGAWK
jgi:4-aminobutyrate aminotransferase-like enzyme